jgi:hypothetical protein
MNLLSETLLFPDLEVMSLHQPGKIFRLLIAQLEHNLDLAVGEDAYIAHALRVEWIRLSLDHSPGAPRCRLPHAEWDFFSSITIAPVLSSEWLFFPPGE